MPGLTDWLNVAKINFGGNFFSLHDLCSLHGFASETNLLFLFHREMLVLRDAQALED